MTALLSKLPAVPAFVSSLGAMSGAEVVNRITRLGTSVALAWVLTPQQFGIIALALTTSEILQAFFVSGLGAKIIQTTDDRLEATCNAAYRLNWVAYLIIFVAQMLAALAVGDFYGSRDVTMLIAALALPLLVYPFSTVQVYRLQRRGQMRLTAKMLAARFGFENIATAVLALSGFGIWAVVIPRLIGAPVWVFAYLRFDDWRPGPAPARRYFGETAVFGGTVLAGELVQAIRLHADKFIIGHFLGLELLGIYYFAFNAGLGITSGLVTACSATLLPHICAADNRRRILETWRKSVKVIYGLTAPVIVLQAALAPIYVPLIFGDKWASASWLVSLLCLSGLALPLWRATGQLLKAIDRPQIELAWIAAHAAIGIAVIGVCATVGLYAIAAGIAVVNFIIIPLAAAVTLRTLQNETSGLVEAS